jgi:hypothetical protein
MSRRDDEPVFVAEYSSAGAADEAWARLTDEAIPSAVISDAPPWGQEVHRIQVARRDAAAALAALTAAG